GSGYEITRHALSSLADALTLSSNHNVHSRVRRVAEVHDGRTNGAALIEVRTASTITALRGTATQFIFWCPRRSFCSQSFPLTKLYVVSFSMLTWRRHLETESLESGSASDGDGSRLVYAVRQLRISAGRNLSYVLFSSFIFLQYVLSKSTARASFSDPSHECKA
ncbi:unnamed protein product, partial [Mycena citricolor]